MRRTEYHTDPNQNFDRRSYREETESFDLAYQGLKSVPIYPEFQKLKHLDLGANDLGSLPNPADLPLIEYLNCSHNRLKSIPIYPRLRSLLASFNNLSDLSGYQHSNLYYLDLGNNQIRSFDFKLPYVSELYLDNLPYERLDLTLYPHLRILDCSESRLKTIVGDSFLEEIEVSSCPITSIPIWNRLKRFYGNHSKIESLGTYPSLEILEANSSSLKILAPQPRLRKLQANHCFLEKLEGMPLLEEIEVSNNCLKNLSLPSSMARIEVGYNPLESFSFSTKSLRNLKIDFFQSRRFREKILGGKAYEYPLKADRVKKYLAEYQFSENILMPILKAFGNLEPGGEMGQFEKISQKVAKAGHRLSPEDVAKIYYQSVMVIAHFVDPQDISNDF